MVAGCGGGSKEATKESASPLRDLFGSTEEIKDRQRKVEEKVGQCMVDKGWQYTPVDVDRLFGGAASVPDDDDAYREKYGYGISIQPTETEVGVGDYTDPNQDYVQTLNETEQDRYYKDLDGEPTGEAEQSVRTGCRAEADRSVEGNLFDDPKFFEALDAMGETYENDPRIIEARQKWSACMKDAGYMYEKPDDVYVALSSRMSELQGFAEQTDLAAETATPSATTAAVEGDSGLSGPIGDPDPVKLKALQDEELATAKADGSCSSKHLTKVQSELDNELYEQLLEQFPELPKK